MSSAVCPYLVCVPACLYGCLSLSVCWSVCIQFQALWGLRVVSVCHSGHSCFPVTCTWSWSTGQRLESLMRMSCMRYVLRAVHPTAAFLCSASAPDQESISDFVIIVTWLIKMGTTLLQNKTKSPWYASPSCSEFSKWLIKMSTGLLQINKIPMIHFTAMFRVFQ